MLKPAILALIRQILTVGCQRLRPSFRCRTGYRRAANDQLGSLVDRRQARPLKACAEPNFNPAASGSCRLKQSCLPQASPATIKSQYDIGRA